MVKIYILLNINIEFHYTKRLKFQIPYITYPPIEIYLPYP